MINYLVRLSNHLDLSGLSKEADYLDAIIKKLAARRRPGSRKGGGSWIENKIQEATRHKKNREALQNRWTGPGLLQSCVVAELRTCQVAELQDFQVAV